MYVFNIISYQKRISKLLYFFDFRSQKLYIGSCQIHIHTNKWRNLCVSNTNVHEKKKNKHIQISWNLLSLLKKSGIDVWVYDNASIFWKKKKKRIKNHSNSIYFECPCPCNYNVHLYTYSGENYHFFSLCTWVWTWNIFVGITESWCTVHTRYNYVGKTIIVARIHTWSLTMSYIYVCVCTYMYDTIHIEYYLLLCENFLATREACGKIACECMYVCANIAAKNWIIFIN